MGKEPEGLIKIDIRKVRINRGEVKKVHIDLQHINYGICKKTGEYNKKKRSNFNVDDVLELVFLLNEYKYTIKGEDETHYYYVSNIFSLKKRKYYRMIFCMDKKKDILGILTIYPQKTN